MEEFKPNEPMDNLSLQDRARFFVMKYLSDQEVDAGRRRRKFKEDEVLLVWFSKTLQNWKAMVVTTVENFVYYEVTHNGDTGETYLDVYVKTDKVVYQKANREDSENS